MQFSLKDLHPQQLTSLIKSQNQLLDNPGAFTLDKLRGRGGWGGSSSKSQKRPNSKNKIVKNSKMKSEIINSELISVLLVGSSCIQSIYITNYRIGYYLDVKLADHQRTNTMISR